jgi:hypothetical protein
MITKHKETRRSVSNETKNKGAIWTHLEVAGKVAHGVDLLGGPGGVVVVLGGKHEPLHIVLAPHEQAGRLQTVPTAAARLLVVPFHGLERKISFTCGRKRRGNNLTLETDLMMCRYKNTA